MVFLRHKRHELPPEPAPVPKPPRYNPWAWIPEGASPARDHQDAFFHPYPENFEAELLRARVEALNASLRNAELHSSQVDGGLEFVQLPTGGVDTDYEVEYAMAVEQVVSGLGVRYRVASYVYNGLTRDDNGVAQVQYLLGSTTSFTPIVDDDGGDAWVELFTVEDLDDFDTYLAAMREIMVKELRHQRIPVTSSALVGRILFDSAHPLWLDDHSATGDLLPTVPGRHDNDTYIPQLYWEYLRVGMPVSYLLAACLPVYKMERKDPYWEDPEAEPYTPATEIEPVPRFSITEVFTLRDQPISLVLTMVGASRGDIIEGAKEP